MESVLTIAPLKWSALLTALTCGAIIGLERQLAGKPAGIPTSCLICLGTYIFVASGTDLTGTDGDPARVLGQVVTGIGFLGAGVMLARDGIIVGVNILENTTIALQRCVHRHITTLRRRRNHRGQHGHLE